MSVSAAPHFASRHNLWIPFFSNNLRDFDIPLHPQRNVFPFLIQFESSSASRLASLAELMESEDHFRSSPRPGAPFGSDTDRPLQFYRNFPCALNAFLNRTISFDSSIGSTSARHIEVSRKKAEKPNFFLHLFDYRKKRPEVILQCRTEKEIGNLASFHWSTFSKAFPFNFMNNLHSHGAAIGIETKHCDRKFENQLQKCRYVLSAPKRSLSLCHRRHITRRSESIDRISIEFFVVCVHTLHKSTETRRATSGSCISSNWLSNDLECFALDYIRCHSQMCKLIRFTFPCCSSPDPMRIQFLHPRMFKWSNLYA